MLEVEVKAHLPLAGPFDLVSWYAIGLPLVVIPFGVASAVCKCD